MLSKQILMLLLSYVWFFDLMLGKTVEAAVKRGNHHFYCHYWIIAMETTSNASSQPP